MQALIIDSWFDNYLGVVSLCGSRTVLSEERQSRVMSTGQAWGVDRIGIFTPNRWTPLGWVAAR
ncbi:hypothetical protein ACNKHX_15865 [Shigella flexneri]